MKPFPFERFARAVNKVHSVLGKEEVAAPIQNSEEFLLIKSDKKMIRIDLKDLQEVVAKGDYVQIGTGEGKRLVHATLSEMTERLSPKGFIRISRSVIIGLQAIALLDGNRVYLTNNSCHPIGASYRDQLMKTLTGRIV